VGHDPAHAGAGRRTLAASRSQADHADPAGGRRARRRGGRDGREQGEELIVAIMTGIFDWFAAVTHDLLGQSISVWIGPAMLGRLPSGIRTPARLRGVDGLCGAPNRRSHFAMDGSTAGGVTTRHTVVARSPASGKSSRCSPAQPRRAAAPAPASLDRRASWAVPISSLARAVARPPLVRSRIQIALALAHCSGHAMQTSGPYAQRESSGLETQPSLLTDEQANRLKQVKPQRCGRAKVDLLRERTLARNGRRWFSQTPQPTRSRAHPKVGKAATL
jgi:hypothetical protein